MAWGDLMQRRAQWLCRRLDPPSPTTEKSYFRLAGLGWWCVCVCVCVRARARASSLLVGGKSLPCWLVALR